MRLFAALNALLFFRVFFPNVDTSLLLCGMISFYMAVSLFMKPPSVSTFYFFYSCAGIVLAYIAYAVITDSFNFFVFYAFFALMVVAFRLDTRWKWESKMSTRRKLMISTWDTASEGTIYGSLIIKAQPLLDFIEQQRKITGKKITITHCCLKCFGLVLRDHPTVNGRLVLGRYYPAETVDIGCLVNIETKRGPDLGLTKLTRADQRSLPDIASELQSAAELLRAGKDDNHNKQKPALGWLPTFLLEPVILLTGWLGSIGIAIPALGVKPFPFGTLYVTSIGMLGLDSAYVPFSPFARVPLLITIGAVAMKAAVDDVTGQVIAEKQLPLSLTVDHRFMDGAQGSRMLSDIKKMLQEPEQYLLD